MSMLTMIDSPPHILISTAEEKRLTASPQRPRSACRRYRRRFAANWNVLTFGPRWQCPLMWCALAQSSSSRSMTAGV